MGTISTPVHVPGWGGRQGRGQGAALHPPPFLMRSPLFLWSARCHMMAVTDEKPWPNTIRAGECELHEPLVRSVLAPNPYPYTFPGTQPWIVGAGPEVAVLAPGRSEQRGVGEGW